LVNGKKPVVVLSSRSFYQVILALKGGEVSVTPDSDVVINALDELWLTNGRQK
jgi:hypothetical protein